MNFGDIEKSFDLHYDGVGFSELEKKVSITRNGCETIYEYLLSDGLRIRRIMTEYPEYGAVEWVDHFENTSDHESGLITELWDCDATLPLAGGKEHGWESRLPDTETDTRICSPCGSIISHEEFHCDTEKYDWSGFANHIYVDNTKEYANENGRSSDGTAPFFNVYTKDEGIIFAIGWSGQWRCRISRGKASVRIMTKIEDTEFRLLPHERIRTSSIVIMPYVGDFFAGQNRWRRLVKAHFSPIDVTSDRHLPFSNMIWGGMSTEGCLKRLDAIEKAGLPQEYIWMDAGWYGVSEKESPDEFEGDWPLYTGDWRVNKKHHPDGLLDVRKKIDDMGKKFLLWFEPERVRRNSPIFAEHPEYLWGIERDGDTDNFLLNLGDDGAWQYCYETLSEKIRELRIDCLRIDFNFPPIYYWRQNDVPGRRGISEIKYVMGLYRLWDALLAEFPSLLIDNCSSGGRRIDIETLRRSVPLWRSDACCNANYPPEIAQKHSMSFGLWMPYSGTSCGREVNDTYRARSAYSPGFGNNYFYSERDEIHSDPKTIEWMRRIGEEYKTVRDYLSADIYPLTDIGNDESWMAVQYDRPECGDGMLMIFKRSGSPYTHASFDLRGIGDGAHCKFTDLDDGSELTIDGSELLERGFELEIKGSRVSKIFTYTKI